ncbi:hypothetical protein T492DRAFT_179593 [Pavlovales sp. CCMP2436]|nr:hypothetical protein T492DRAFT_179593 [Pavlovales sp. CCMP2436]
MYENTSKILLPIIIIVLAIINKFCHLYECQVAAVEAARRVAHGAHAALTGFALVTVACAALRCLLCVAVLLPAALSVGARVLGAWASGGRLGRGSERLSPDGRRTGFQRSSPMVGTTALYALRRSRTMQALASLPCVAQLTTAAAALGRRLSLLYLQTVTTRRRQHKRHKSDGLAGLDRSSDGVRPRAYSDEDGVQLADGPPPSNSGYYYYHYCDCCCYFYYD